MVTPVVQREVSVILATRTSITAVTLVVRGGKTIVILKSVALVTPVVQWLPDGMVVIWKRLFHRHVILECSRGRRSRGELRPHFQSHLQTMRLRFTTQLWALSWQDRTKSGTVLTDSRFGMQTNSAFCPS